MGLQQLDYAYQLGIKRVHIEAGCCCDWCRTWSVFAVAVFYSRVMVFGSVQTQHTHGSKPSILGRWQAENLQKMPQSCTRILTPCRGNGTSTQTTKSLPRSQECLLVHHNVICQLSPGNLVRTTAVTRGGHRRLQQHGPQCSCQVHGHSYPSG